MHHQPLLSYVLHMSGNLQVYYLTGGSVMTTVSDLTPRGKHLL